MQWEACAVYICPESYGAGFLRLQGYAVGNSFSLAAVVG